MTVMAFIILTPQQAEDSTELNGGDYNVAPMEITNTLADNLGHGTLVGQFVLPARLLNDPGYAPWVPSLGSLPIHVLDSETIFLPQPEEV